MKKDVLLRLFALLFFLSSILLVYALEMNPTSSNSPESYFLTQGKNEVIFNSTFFASLIRTNKDIEVVSYTNERTNTTIGYVNAFNGLGKNFLIIPGEKYEIIAKTNTTFKL